MSELQDRMDATGMTADEVVQDLLDDARIAQQALDRRQRTNLELVELTKHLENERDMYGTKVLEAMSMIQALKADRDQWREACEKMLPAETQRALEHERDEALAAVAALGAVLRQAHDADALAEWFTDTDKDGVDVRGLLASTQAAASAWEARVESRERERLAEWIHKNRDTISEFGFDKHQATALCAYLLSLPWTQDAAFRPSPAVIAAIRAGEGK